MRMRELLLPASPSPPAGGLHAWMPRGLHLAGNAAHARPQSAGATLSPGPPWTGFIVVDRKSNTGTVKWPKVFVPLQGRWDCTCVTQAMRQAS